MDQHIIWAFLGVSPLTLVERHGFGGHKTMNTYEDEESIEKYFVITKSE